MLNNNVVKGTQPTEVPMYREPHLQRKSDKCAALWKEWYNYKFGLKNEEKAKEYRKLWGKCCDEHSKMISQEVKTNPRYRDMEMY